MSKKDLDLMFELNGIEKVEIEHQKKDAFPSPELELYIEEKKRQSMWEKIKYYANFDILKRFYSNLPLHLKRLHSNSSIFYRPVPF